MDAAEVERRRKQTADRVAKFRAKGKAPAEKKEPEEKAPELSAKEEKNLERDIRCVIDALWLAASWLALLVGRELEDLTEPELGDGARAWLPVCRKHTWLLSIGRWLTAPLWLVQMVRRKIHKKRDAKEAPPAKPADLAAPAALPAAPAGVTPAGGNAVTLRVVPSLPENPAAAALAAQLERESEAKG